MFKKIRAFFQNQTGETEETSRSSRDTKEVAAGVSGQKLALSSREFSGHDPWQTNFENIRKMLKSFSKRIESIKNNPEESYLINTEVLFRLLEVLENFTKLTEKNASSLEKMAENIHRPIPKIERSYEKRRAREVIAVLESNGELTYNQLRNSLKPPISYNRVTALIAEMMRDGIALKKRGRPVKVSLTYE
jgi:hypothetical protein